jgi:hypothetical protein
MKRFLALIFLTLIACRFAVAQTEWSIVGEAVPAGGVARLTQDPADAQTYTYAGHLDSRPFKLTDGTALYVPACGDNDPLGQTVSLRSASDPSETGFRIRYTKPSDFFRLTLKTTPAGAQQITLEQEIPPGQLYIVGGPLNTHDPNWLLSDAKELEPDATNPFVFRYKGYLAYNSFGDERGNIKFLLGRSWDPAWHPAGTANAPLTDALKTPIAMRLGGADTKWTIPSDGSGNGYYEISLNTFDKTICVDSFRYSAEAYPDKIYLAGAAVPCDWDKENPEVMTPIADRYGSYAWSGTVAQGEFKFLQAKGTWGRCYVATSAAEQIVFNHPHPIVYEFEYYNNGGHDYKFVMPEAGAVTVAVDLKAMTATVRKQHDESALPSTTAAEAVAIRYDRPARLLRIEATSDEAAGAIATVVGMNGATLVCRTIGNGIVLSLPAGVYGVAVSGAKTVLRKKIAIY